MHLFKLSILYGAIVARAWDDEQNHYETIFTVADNVAHTITVTNDVIRTITVTNDVAHTVTETVNACSTYTPHAIACQPINHNNINFRFNGVARYSISPEACFYHCKLSPQTPSFPWYFSEAYTDGNPVTGESICTCYTNGYTVSATAATSCIAGYGISGVSEFIYQIDK